MIKEDKEKIMDEIMEIGSKIHGLVTANNQKEAYEIIDELCSLQDKVFNL